MRIAELIEYLSNINEEHGNIEVVNLNRAASLVGDALCWRIDNVKLEIIEDGNGDILNKFAVIS